MNRRNAIRFLAACATLPIFAACASSTVPTAALPAALRVAHGLGDAALRGARGVGDVTYQGCPVFGHGGPYNTVVTGSPIDPHSAQYISSVIQAGDTMGFYASTGVEQVNLADDKTPLLKVAPKVRYHPFPLPYPWESNFFIEPLSDAHAMVVHTQHCHLYEAYGTSYRYPTLSAYCGANWNLRNQFVPLAPGTPSSMASGLSLFAGMVRWEDYESGSINHALSWDGIAHTLSEYTFVRPASDTDWLSFQGSSGYQLPYGAHLRLHASFSTSGWGPQSAMVANAMKKYGVYLADTGSSANGIMFANASDGSNPWNSHDLSALSNIKMSDFDVLTLGPILHVPGH